MGVEPPNDKDLAGALAGLEQSEVGMHVMAELIKEAL
jgi:hypothetical protein